MARNRQRAKQRQAERRAARRSDEGARPPGTPEHSGAPGEPDGDGAELGDGRRGESARVADETPESAGLTDGGREPAGPPDGDPALSGIGPPGIDAPTGADLAANAPPEAIGRSDTVAATSPPPLLADPESDPEAAASRATVGEASDEPEEVRGRNKVIAFLIASWAELKRVQWPNRQQTTTLTGIVLGFVIIMGAYLGGLDAVFSRLVQLVI